MTSRPSNRSALLVMVSGTAVGQTFSLRSRHCVIGRDEHADIRLADPTISRYHALVVLDPDGTASVRDLGSSNGTRVNGQSLSSERPLVEGDEIVIGVDTVLKLTYGSA